MSRRGCIGRPTVQIHLTRSCNLRCLHCYSESGPRMTETLPPDAVRRFLDDARAAGYEVAAFSGGEPFLYEALPEIVAHARGLGFVTTCVTNGTVAGARFERAATSFDALAVSVDGRPDEHDRLRDSPRAFASTRRGLGTLRRLAVSFGIAHTARKETISSLRWLAEFAIAEGARLLQLHPLGAAGNAVGSLAAEVPDLADCARIHLLAAILRQDLGEQLRVQVDLMNRDVALARPAMVLADDEPDDDTTPLAELVNPLVLTSSGEILPLTHGLCPAFRIGNVHHERLRSAAPDYVARRHAGLRRLCRALLRDEIAHLPLPYFDWYESVAVGSRHTQRGIGPTCGVARSDRSNPTSST